MNFGPACFCSDETPGRAPWGRIIVGAFLSVNTMGVALAVNLSPVTEGERLVLHVATLTSALIVTALLGPPLWVATLQSLRSRTLTLEALFAMSYAGAMTGSITSMLTGVGSVFFEVAGILLVVYSLGRELGRYTQERVLRSLSDWNPERQSCERIHADGSATRANVAEIVAGDVLRVHPGVAVPVDGVVLKGQALLCESEISGESFAVRRECGDTVWAGSTVLDSTILVWASVNGTERQVDRITAALEALRTRPAEAQVAADRIMKWFVPLLAAVCAAAAGFWYWQAGFAIALFNAMAVLLVACPCALGFATPIAVWCAMQRLREAGFLARNGAAVEHLAAADTIVFDKTGTLTLPDSYRASLSTRDGVDELHIRRLIACAESASTHPLAQALRGLGPAMHGCELEYVEIIPAAGIRVRMKDEHGEHELIIRMAGPADGDPAHRLSIHLEGEHAATVRLEEALSPNLEPAMMQLQSANIRPVLLTGDDAARAARIPIAERHSRMKPDDKRNLIAKLRDEGRRVAYIGDGINDAAAMSIASIGIAPTHASGLAHDAAGMVWMSLDPRSLVEAVAICRRTVRSIRLTIWIALAYNIAGVAFAAAGALHPVIASLLMTVSSLIVTFRSLRVNEEVQ